MGAGSQDVLTQPLTLCVCVCVREGAVCLKRPRSGCQGTPARGILSAVWQPRVQRERRALAKSPAEVKRRRRRDERGLPLPPPTPPLTSAPVGEEREKAGAIRAARVTVGVLKRV